MHLLASLAAHGWHAAAWRVTGAAAFAGATPFRAMAKTAEQGGLDAVLLGLPTAPRARRDGGKVDGIRLDPLPLVAAMIGATERIGLCAWWPGDVAEPFHVARVFATLDHLASGRTGWIAGLEGAEELGTRFGHTNLPATEEDSATRLVELIDVARQLWDSWEDRGFVVDQASGTFADPAHVHPIEHAGRFFTVRGPLNVPRPVQGQPVILHRDVPAGPMRSGAAASAEVVLAECATIAEAAASRARLARIGAKARPRSRGAALRRSRDGDPRPSRSRRRRERAAELDGLAGVDGHQASVPRFVGTPDQFADWLARMARSRRLRRLRHPARRAAGRSRHAGGGGGAALAPPRSAARRLRACRRCAAISACGAPPAASPPRGNVTWRGGKCISACSPIPADITSRAGAMARSIRTRSSATTTIAESARPGRARQVRPVLRRRHAGGAREGRPRHRPRRAEQHRIPSRSPGRWPAPPSISVWWRRSRPPTTSPMPSPSASPRSITSAAAAPAGTSSRRRTTTRPSTSAASRTWRRRCATSAPRNSSISARACGTAGRTMPSADRASGVFVDRGRCKTLDHQGQFFSVRGRARTAAPAAGLAGAGAGRRFARRPRIRRDHRRADLRRAKQSRRSPTFRVGGRRPRMPRMGATRSS